MEFNISTFILEIINFLVLIWILQHFLYKPVLGVINKRRDSVDKVLADAQKLRVEAETLQQKYANRLTHWQQEKKQALETLHQEIESERSRQMRELKKQLEEERKKAQIITERRLQEFQSQSEKRALEQGARFASLLLRRAAGPELENNLFALLLDDLGSLTAERVQSLQSMLGPGPERIQISSVYELDKSKRKQLEQILNRLINRSAEYEYCLEPALIAGFRISMGSWLLQANIQHELTGFVEIGHAAD